jgi:hypothetical protein
MILFAESVALGYLRAYIGSVHLHEEAIDGHDSIKDFIIETITDQDKEAEITRSL